MRTLIAAALVLASVMAIPAHAGDAAKGKDKAAAVCGACHGPDGNSTMPDFPRLAGQPEDYLVKALSDYKSGKRKNPIMGPQAEALSKGEMADVAAWFASQQGLMVKH